MKEEDNAGCSCHGQKSATPDNACGPAPASNRNEIKTATSVLTFQDKLTHVLARLGIRRGGWRVEPGLYRLGDAGEESPVLVTANYKLSFDALRSALSGMDAFILVLDTFGINVWCAAGKGTFGTDELVSRIESSRLADVVTTRRMLVPQLGTTGVAAHEVKARSGFKVDYGPVRAEDIPEFLRAGKATPEMRRIRFDLRDRVVLIPVEANQALPIAAGVSLAAYIADGTIASAGIAGAAIAGLVGVPVLLPWLPADEYSAKGFILGGIVALATAGTALLSDDGSSLTLRLMRAASYVLAIPPLTAFIALNFTGATPYPSPSGVRKEIFRYVPVMAGMTVTGIIVNVAQKIARMRKG